jgi:hypothetical protein
MTDEPRIYHGNLDQLNSIDAKLNRECPHRRYVPIKGQDRFVSSRSPLGIVESRTKEQLKSKGYDGLVDARTFYAGDDSTVLIGPERFCIEGTPVKIAEPGPFVE